MVTYTFIKSSFTHLCEIFPTYFYFLIHEIIKCIVPCDLQANLSEWRRQWPRPLKDSGIFFCLQLILNDILLQHCKEPQQPESEGK